MRHAGYSAVAIVFHWAIAAAIIGNLALGWWMGSALEVAATQAQAIAGFQLHKSLGFTILGLSLLRLAWRLLHKPPPLPPMPAWEKFATKATHWAFYALMIVVPLSGWTYVSAQWRGEAPLSVPTLWFGLFEVPHLFDTQALSAAERRDIASRTFTAHFYLAWGMAALLALHVGAALKHRFINRDTVLANMLPAATAARTGGAVAILLATAALVFAVVRTPGAADTSSAVIGNLPDSAWTINPDSEITFSGVHAGVPFTGRFTRWRAGIQFIPDRLDAAAISAIIETGSATDGVPLHDETLPQAEWFDVAQHPTATFRSTGIRPLGADRYELDGSLTIKGRALALSPLLLTIANDELTLGGRVKISRADANLGMESDPDAAYVSNEIVVTVRVAAAR